MTTDYTAAQRAIETRSQALLFAKNKTKGVFTSDPRENADARLYKRMHYNTIIQNNLTIIDQSAVLLARDHKLPIHVFDFSDEGAMTRICRKEDIGTTITDTTDVLV